MSEFTEDQEVVLDIIKEWLREQDAAFLAKEEQVVFWGPLDGNIRKQGWNKLKLREAASIIRSTKVPVGIMKHCTEDMIRAAAQEESRTYVSGCNVHGMVSKQYFNFYTTNQAVFETMEHRCSVALITELEQLGENILWRDLSHMYTQALKYLGRPVPHAIAVNNLLRFGLKDSRFIEKRNTKTYNGRYVYREDGKLKQAICIKLPEKSGLKQDWTNDMKRDLIIRAVKHLRKD